MLKFKVIEQRIFKNEIKFLGSLHFIPKQQAKNG